MSLVSPERPLADLHGQALLDDVVRLFTDLLLASGATMSMIKIATSKALSPAVDSRLITATFTELGALQRDCMEVMCTWRRDVEFVDDAGEPMPLARIGPKSFAALCSQAFCKHPAEKILDALLEFGAVSIRDDAKVVSETPTFLLGRAAAGGRLATDVLLRHVEGYLRVVHGNVCSVSGHGKQRFERACTVSVAAELEPIFHRLVRHRGQEFIDSIDEWLERNTKFESPAGRYLELGAGAYFVDLGHRSQRTPKK